MLEAYLVVSGKDGDPTSHLVSLVADLGRAVASWSPSTRLSPIYLWQEGSIESKANDPFDGQCFLVFLGTLHPAVVQQLAKPEDQIWLTMGAFNAVIRTDSAQTVEQIFAWAETDEGKWRPSVEAWEVVDGEIVSTTHSPADTSGEPTDWRGHLSAMVSAKRATQLDELVREYVPLAASAISRSSRTVPKITQDLWGTHLYVREKVTRSESADTKEVYRTFGTLTTINAGLSRFSSQAFSGTIPILETECHFWTHSLLGIAIPSIALWKFATFVTGILDENRLSQRLAHFADISPPRFKDLQNVDGGDAYWRDDLLHQQTLTTGDKNEPILPAIVYFSGRDGFRSTNFTLSAPLAVISACNSKRWTLLTLTHEISHNLVRSALTKLFPRATPEGAKKACELMQRDAANELESLSQYLILVAYVMESVEEGNRKLPYEPERMIQVMDRWHHEIEEIMVHVVDLLYFYNGNHQKYVEGIWLSWSVIPNIGNRVHEYVLRTLCAVMALHLSRGKKTEEVTRRQVEEVFADIRERDEDNQYIEQAIKYLDNNWDLLAQRMNARRGLVKIARAAAFSTFVRGQLRGDEEAGAASEPRGGYPHRFGEFTTEPIENPLKWIDEYTTRLDVRPGDSLWMMYMLAFNVAS